MPFIFHQTSLADVIRIVPRTFGDDRGFFVETYKRSEFAAAGIHDVFVQDNHSRSSARVVRGLHYQREPSAQSKLVRVVRGVVFDVAVDIRRGSPTFGRWVGVELSEDNKEMLYVPRGFAHGFAVLSGAAEVVYKVSCEYDAAADAGIAWDDPDVGVVWPIADPVLSEKDRRLPRLRDVAGDFVYRPGEDAPQSRPPWRDRGR